VGEVHAREPTTARPAPPTPANQRMTAVLSGVQPIGYHDFDDARTLVEISRNTTDIDKRCETSSRKSLQSTPAAARLPAAVIARVGQRRHGTQLGCRPGEWAADLADQAPVSLGDAITGIDKHNVSTRPCPAVTLPPVDQRRWSGWFPGLAGG
jgi:hypothetical protein